MSNDNQEALSALYESLRIGDMKMYQLYYRDFKQDFIRYGRKYTPDRDLILDAYHDTFIILYENILSGRLSEMTSSLKTYVFSVGKYTLLNKLRKRRKTIHSDDLEIRDLPVKSELEEIDQSEVSDHLRQAIRSLGDACQSLLILFYYKKYSIEAMMHELGYKNENTVKAYKSRCLRKLKSLINTQAKPNSQ